MRREEQIVKQATFDNNSYLDNNYYAFKRGVKWADENPKDGLISIDKVCELLENIDFDMTYWNSEDGFNKEQFIKDFRKAIEE